MALKKTLGATGFLTVLGFIASFASLVVISYFFGTSAQLDAYWIAFTIMNVLASLAAPMREALVPEFHRRLQQDAHKAMQYFSQTMTLILIVAFGGALIAWGLAEPLASLAVSSNNSEISVLTVNQIYWLAPAVVLLVVSETLNSLLVVYNRVIFQSASRLLGTISSLFILGVCSGLLNAHALPIAFISAQTVTIVVQTYALYKEGLKFRIARPIVDTKFLAVSGSLLISYAASQGYTLLEKHALTFFEAGLVSSFQYAVSLTNVIITLVGVTISAVLWPRMLSFAATKDHAIIFTEAMLTTRLIFLGLGGLCAIVWLNASSIVTLLFARGAFTTSDIPRAAEALQLAVFAAVPISVYFSLSKALLSVGAAKSLMVTGLFVAISGSLILACATISQSSTLALSHWVTANVAGLIVQISLLWRACGGFTKNKLQQGVWWVFRWLVVLIGATFFTEVITRLDNSVEFVAPAIALKIFVFLAFFAVLSWQLKLTQELSSLLRPQR